MATIGTVVLLTGSAIIVDATGAQRILNLGDSIQSGDSIVAPTGTIVELQLVNGNVVQIGSEQTVTFTQELSDAILYNIVDPTDKTVSQATIQSLIQAIQTGDNIDDIVAALTNERSEVNDGVNAGSQQGHTFVDLLRIDDVLNKFNYSYEVASREYLDGSRLIQDREVQLSDGLSNTINLPRIDHDLNVFGFDYRTPNSEFESRRYDTIRQSNDPDYLVSAARPPAVNPPSNISPTASFSSASGVEDTTNATLNLAGNDPDGSIVSVTVTALPPTTQGILYLADGVTTVVAGTPLTPAQATGLIFIPALNFNGSVNVPFVVTDNDGATSDPVTAQVTVSPVNDAPVISSAVQTGATSEDGPLTASGQVTATDVDHDAVLAYSGNAAGSYGNFTVNATTGAWLYTMTNTQSLSANDSFSETFTVTVTDDEGATTTQDVTITVSGTNDAPVISSAVQTGATSEDGPLTASGQVTATDVDHDAVLAYSGNAAGSYGNFTVNATTGAWLYTMTNTQSLSANDSFSETFTVTVTDDEGATTTQDVTITVSGTNDAPVISSAVQTGATSEDGPLTASGQVTATDVDHDAVLAYSGNAAGSYGNFTVNATTGAWLYTMTNTQSLSANDSFSETFTVTVTDDEGATTTQDVTITVSGTNDAPVISSAVQTGATSEDGPLTASGQVTATDVDHDAVLAYSGNAAGSYGNFTVNATTGAWLYTMTNTQSLSANDSFSETFTVTVTDDEGATTTQDVTITVSGTNDAPVISSAVQTGATSEDGPLTASGQVTATDVDHDAVLAYSGNAAGSYGNFTVNATTGAWLYTMTNTQSLSANDSFSETFTVTVTDDEGATTTQDVTITVSGTNDAAVITGTSTGSVTEASGVANAITGTPTATGTLISTDVDNAATFTAVGTTASTGGYGTYQMTAGGVWTYTINNNNAAVQALNTGGTLTDTFTVTSIDGTAKVVTVTINGANDAPAGIVDSFVVTEGTSALLGNVLANDTDVDSGALTVGQFAVDGAGTGAQTANGINSITTALGGTVVMNADGTFTYTAPAFRDHDDATPDIDSFTYRASDGAATSAWTTVSINLADTSLTANDDVDSLGAGTSITGNVITGAGGTIIGGADVLGADAASITNVAVTQGAQVSNAVGAGNVRTIVTTNGTLAIDQDDGSYTYTKAANIVVTNPTGTASFTSVGVNLYGFDTAEPYVTVGNPASGLVLANLNATSAARARFQDNAGETDDGVGAEQNAGGTTTTNMTENGEQLVISLGVASKATTIALSNLVAGETATWETYNAAGALVSSGTTAGIAGGQPSINITSATAFEYVVVRSTGASNFRVDGVNVTRDISTPDIFTYTLTDIDGSTSSATLTINPGVAPVIDLDASAAGTGFATTFTQGGSAVSLADTDISITDADSINITRATITLTNAQAGDVLAAGALPGGITASIVGNVVTLTGSATLANYQTAIRAITFGTTSTNTVSRSINVVVTDGVNNSNTATTTVAVSLLNAPVIDLDLSGAGTGFATTYTENGVAVSIADTDIRITDVDSTNVTGATITLTNAQSGDMLSAGILPGGISSSIVGNVVTLSGASSLANYQAAIRAITFANSTESPDTTPRIINVVVTDGTSNSNTATATIAVIAVNDAPVNTVPGAQTTAEDISKAITGLSISDVDAGSGSMTVTLSVTNGTLTVTGGSATIIGSGTGTVTLTGTVAAINATLASNVTYLSALNYYGSDILTMTTSDNGNTGTGGTLIDVDTVNLTITSVTDAPQIIMPASLSSVHAGTPTAAINTTTAITQANIETALGLPAGSLDNRFDPPTGGANDPGNVDVFDGAYSNYAITLGAGSQVAFDWSFFNGEIVLSEINQGYNDIAVLVITAPNGVVTYQLLSSSEQTGINVNGTAVDATGTVNYTATTTGQYQFSWLVLNAIDGNNDSQLSVGAPKIYYNGNSYATPITFPINVLPVGDETIGLITISGLPLSGVGFSFIGSNGVAVGTNLGGGSWSFTESQLSSLQLLTPPDYVGTMNLTVSAIGTENGIDATATQNISIEVAATTVSIMGTQAGNTLTGSATNDLIDGLGGNDTIDGGSGNDILSGGAGNDNLSGGIGNDLLMGGSGNDMLNGGAGNDTLIGGAGNDTMTGGLGVDVFKWELADKGVVGTPAADIVTDFDVASRVAGGDVLDLRDLLTGENQTNLTNYLHFEKSGANTIVHISDSGAYAGGFNSANDVQVITLQNVDLVGSFANDQQVIADLLTKQKLITD